VTVADVDLVVVLSVLVSSQSTRHSTRILQYLACSAEAVKTDAWGWRLAFYIAQRLIEIYGGLRHNTNSNLAHATVAANLQQSYR